MFLDQSSGLFCRRCLDFHLSSSELELSCEPGSLHQLDPEQHQHFSRNKKLVTSNIRVRDSLCGKLDTYKTYSVT